jgi:hypothetical protein
VAWKTLAALAIVVSGAVAAFAICTFGLDDSSTANGGSAPKRTDPFVKTVSDATGTYRVYTLRDGDYVRRSQAAVECLASQEGGFPNLFCLRIGGGRHSIVFYKDSVQVYGPDAEPLTPSESFDWQPK